MVIHSGELILQFLIINHLTIIATYAQRIETKYKNIKPSVVFTILFKKQHKVNCIYMLVECLMFCLNCYVLVRNDRRSLLYVRLKCARVKMSPYKKL